MFQPQVTDSHLTHTLLQAPLKIFKTHLLFERVHSTGDETFKKNKKIRYTCAPF